LTEGYLDVISLHQFGYTNACGVLGTALTKEQVRRLAGFSSTVELLFDGDAPGRKAALRSAEMILGAGLNCRVVILPQEEDIDSLLHNRWSRGV
jgi:DNA primase (EC 2.7.7.-)